ncbi:MAG: PIN domain nuclease [Caldilineaceae bacterium]|nr:PIN domain nuclease [Caldilineaceae bacterium]
MRWDRFLRVVVLLIGAWLGWELGRTFTGIRSFDELRSTFGTSAQVIIPSILGGGLVGFLIAPWVTVRPARALRSSLRGVPTIQLLAGTGGLAVGLMIAALLAYPLSLLPNPFGTILPFAGAILFGYLAVTVMLVRQKEIFSFFRIGRGDERDGERDGAAGEFGLGSKPAHSLMLLDTSVIIDGRIADVAETGFLWGTLAVPRFVLNELQYIADSSDVLRRNRGRRGLEMLDRLQHNEAVEILFLDQDPSDAKQVDDKLISLGMELNAAVVTNDYNLNRVARLQGVTVLNINELANAVKSVVLPGEEMEIRVIQEGKEINQGVGYLEDGTMVVVENGRRHLNDLVLVQVTKVLQTNAGRLIFAAPEVEQRPRVGQR